MIRLTRRLLARYVAEELVAGRQGVITQVAAYLVEAKRTKEVDLLVRDIEKALEGHGIVAATVISATKLESSAKGEIESLLKKRYNASNVILKTSLDGDVLGGVMVRTAGDEFDASVRRNINRLKALKV